MGDARRYLRALHGAVRSRHSGAGPTCRQQPGDRLQRGRRVDAPGNFAYYVYGAIAVAAAAALAYGLTDRQYDRVIIASRIDARVLGHAAQVRARLPGRVALNLDPRGKILRMKHEIEVDLPEEVLAAIDAVRGEVSRFEFLGPASLEAIKHFGA